MKKAYVVGFILIVAFAALGMGQFKKTLRTYVGFSEARAAGAVVQVKGKIDKSSVQFAKDHSTMDFVITNDKGDKMSIVFLGTVPANFSQATHVVVVGQYRKNAFYSNEMLIKCPSKYQGEPKPGG